MKNILIAILVSILAAYGTVVMTQQAGPNAQPKESVYDRVIRTGTIRCGYALYEPLIMKDANSGKLHGVFYDLMNQMGEELNLKINWVAEVGYGEIEDGFLANKYDVFCAGAVITPKRAKFTFYTMPIYYQTTMAWVRADDTRFDDNLRQLNSPNVTLATRDGDVTQAIAQKLFPKAKTIVSPQMADYMQMLVDVQTGKADATFFEKSFGDKFLRGNPSTVKISNPNSPTDVSQVAMMLPFGDYKLKYMLDASLSQMLLNGSVKEAFHANAPDYDLWSAATPYQH
ncbi:MAG: transporter substrate-binding domain-containing protein [Alphaproteobacteria bacterium]|nr:transporter substrate-binding domain-containing protein [Alphaproteobacteria bacterium]